MKEFWENILSNPEHLLLSGSSSNWPLQGLRNPRRPASSMDQNRNQGIRRKRHSKEYKKQYRQKNWGWNKKKEISPVKEVVPALIEPQAVQKVAPCSRTHIILSVWQLPPPVLHKSLKWIVFTKSNKRHELFVNYNITTQTFLTFLVSVSKENLI